MAKRKTAGSAVAEVPQTRAEIELQVWKEVALRLSAGQGAAPAIPAPAPVVAKPEPKAAKEAPKTDWSKVRHTCPSCGTEGSVSDVFGTRWARGIEYKQSYCHSCRSKASATSNFQRQRAYSPKAKKPAP